jgi:hypothetical protein
MKRYILGAFAGAVLMLASAYGQTPKSASERSEAVPHAGRVHRQNDRIKQGVQNGTLSRNQAGRLARQDARINREARGMAARNGGRLNQRQEARIRHQMNRQSRRIYRAKH